jgi:hypothetical protein
MKNKIVTIAPIFLSIATAPLSWRNRRHRHHPYEQTYLELFRSTVQRGGGSTAAAVIFNKLSLPQAVQVDSAERGRVHCRCRRRCRHLGPLKRRLLATVHILLALQAAHILLRHLPHLCRGGFDGIGQRYSPTCNDQNSILIFLNITAF